MGTKQGKVALVLGTRPEIIKLSPIIRCLHRQRRPCFILHTGQHYSYEMDRLFFEELDLPQPVYHLSVRSTASRHADHTGRMMAGIEEVFLKDRPRVVLVQGDTNTVLAGSLVTAKLPGTLLGHVEAGLRSYDRAMPEEINRLLSDHASDFLFAPTKGAERILLGEGIPKRKVFVTGNTIVDAVMQNLSIAERKTKGDKLVPQGKRDFFLMTLHRQENVDDRKRLSAILEGLRKIVKTFQTPVLFPVHPRTLRRLREFGLALPKGVEAIKPVGFLRFLALEARARLILTDSGGVQEEACILKVPCVTLRTTTERPETVEAGANLIAGFQPDSILRSSVRMMAGKREWPNPFGDGHSAEKMVRILEPHLS